MAAGMMTVGLGVQTAQARGRVVIRGGGYRGGVYYRGVRRGYNRGYSRGYYGYPRYRGGYYGGYRGYGYGYPGYYGYGYPYGGSGIYFRF